MPAKARYMNWVGFEILARTPVPKLPLSYPPSKRRHLELSVNYYYYCGTTKTTATTTTMIIIIIYLLLLLLYTVAVADHVVFVSAVEFLF